MRRRLVTALLRLLARYEGASYSTTRSVLPGAVQSARFDAGAATRTELVRKSRYFEKNNAVQNRLADLFETYTVGSGLQVTPASSDPAWNARAKAWWEEWTRVPDTASRQSFGTLQGLLARSWFVDGEIFVLLTRSLDTGRPRIQLVESHLCGTPPELAALEGSRIIDGIAVDGTGRPAAYYFADEESKGRKVYSPKPADFVVHVFEPARAGQYRGLPFCYPVINDLHDLDDLQILEMKAAKDAAEITNIVNTQHGELDAETLLQQAGEVTTQNLNGTSVVERRAQAVRDALGGRTVALFNGEDFKQFQSNRPSVATAGYWRFLTEKVCSGVGIPYVLVFPDSMQGTVYRGALDMANSFFRARSLTPAAATWRIFEYVIGWARFNDRRLADPPADWNKVTIHAPRSVNVDVGRNSVAMISELEGGTRTFSDVYGELGHDYREKLRQKAAEAKFVRELAAEFGVTVAEISTILEDKAERVRTEPQEPTPSPDPDDPALDADGARFGFPPARS